MQGSTRVQYFLFFFDLDRHVRGNRVGQATDGSSMLDREEMISGGTFLFSFTY